MCFYAEYDWVASIVEQGEQQNTKNRRCGECGRVIDIGTTCIVIDQYESEDGADGCIACEKGDCQCEYDRCCQCVEPTRGEQYHTVRCLDCNAFLNAIQMAEEELGCHYNESRPPLDEMMEYLCNVNSDDAERYRVVAIREYPWLQTSGYLTWLWELLF